MSTDKTLRHSYIITDRKNPVQHSCKMFRENVCTISSRVVIACLIFYNNFLEKK